MRALLACLVLVIGAAWAVIRHLPTTDAQAESFPALHPQEIRSVSLDGRGLPLAALRDALATRTGQAIELATLARDRGALEQVLVARGYLAARVEQPLVTFGISGAFVTFEIEQGPLFRIRNVSIKGATALDAGVVTLGGGEPADASRIALARHALEQRLRARGHAGVVVATLSPDPSVGLVDVELAATR